MTPSGRFKTFVSCDVEVFRGTDFRSRNVGFALVIDRGSESERDA